jgi:hypothetical protein
MMSADLSMLPANRIRHLSMSERSAALLRRQTRLIERAAAQRAELGAARANLEAPLGWLRKGLAVITAIRSHPQIALLSTLAASLTFVRQTSKVRNWAVRGLAMHQLYKVLASGFMRARAATRDSSLL